jgi:hypothetical protein
VIGRQDKMWANCIGLGEHNLVINTIPISGYEVLASLITAHFIITLMTRRKGQGGHKGYKGDHTSRKIV